ncbi:serine-rich adhesin for platelets [Anabrus simplex]|uniref:serine-rich adhesin for platelets n=1 Tax=Anabrus simplex TaxID=316456 RepID=UPI0035A2F4E6
MVFSQADLAPDAIPCYESEDEAMGRRHKVLGRNKRGTPLYSKQDIREQYCITRQQLDVLEQAQGSGGLFGCLSSYHDSSCRSSQSLLSVCVRRKVPSDENLHELCRRPTAAYAPIPRWPRYPPPAPPPPEMYPYDDDLECSYFRRRPKSLCSAADPKRYTWMPEDEEATRMERPRPIRPDLEDSHSDYEVSSHSHYHNHYHPPSHHPLYGPPRSSCLSYLSYSSEYLACPAHPELPPPPPPPALPHHDMPPRTKHVSFARSHTLTSFDDAVTCKAMAVACSQERLIDGKKAPGDGAGSAQHGGGSVGDSPKVVILEKVKRAPMKTQATQTEVCLGRKPMAPHYLSLSPRTIHRVRMVSQGAQTNGGERFISRRGLMKSYSEAGGRFGVVQATETYEETSNDHEPLQRTQSEEPPRSPFLVTTPPETILSSSSAPPATTSPAPVQVQPTTTATTTTATTVATDSSVKKKKAYKEIFIDFEPQGVERRAKKRMLQKTLSEGEILVDRRTLFNNGEAEMDTASVSQEGISEDRNYPYYQNEDVFLEPLEKKSVALFSSIPAELATSSPLLLEDSQEDEFHENLIYRGLFRKRSVSLEDAVSSTASDQDMPVFHQARDEEYFSDTKSAPPSPERKLSRQPAEDKDDIISRVSEPQGEKEEVQPPTTPLTQRSSPFASSDSLANDLRDHSDGIWNESQATVLQADLDNGTGMSSSDLSSLAANSLGAATALALTPSSRRKQLLLLQHQQRSSMDTEALEEELAAEATDVQQVPLSPRIRIEAPQPKTSPIAPVATVAVTTQTTTTTTTPSQEVPLMLEEAKLFKRRSSATPDSSLDRSDSHPLRERILSPGHRRGELRRRRSPAGSGSRTTPESSLEPSLQSQESETSRNTNGTSSGTLSDLLARTDSGKTGTDLSEASTTEDYITANDNNSGTDTSSRRNGSHRVNEMGGAAPVTGGGSIGGAGDGSSFESASSMYSFARGDLSTEDLLQASCSPPPIMEENSSDLPTTPIVESENNQASTTPRVSVDMTIVQKPEATSPSGESSSSCGSYSIEGSMDDLDKKAEGEETELPPVSPKEKQKTRAASASDEEHSGHYSSSGYYESPVDEEDEAECVSGTERKEWTDEEKRRKKKAFKLDFSPIMDKEGEESPPTAAQPPRRDSDTWSRRSSGKSEKSNKSERSSKEEVKNGRRGEKKSSPEAQASAGEGELLKDKERPTTVRKGKSRSSPVQHHRRPPSGVPVLPGAIQVVGKKVHREKADKEPITPGMVRSPAMHEGFRTEDWGTPQRSTPAHTPEEGTLLGNSNHVNTGTSDDSSCGHNYPASEGGSQQQSSPRRHRRVRDSPRRKVAGTGGRSPTATQQRPRRRSGSTEDKTISTAVTLARRRSSIPAKSPSAQPPLPDEPLSAPVLLPKGSRLSPHRYSRSPGGSPSRRHKSKGSPKQIGDKVCIKMQGAMSPESSRLKALSAESLRSVSPGSDSVFYSESADPSNNVPTSGESAGVLCHHCGREVDSKTLSSGPEDTEQGNGEGAEPEQPDIVQPPAGFADSPDGPRSKPASGGRLYKKLEKRFRSEERGGHGERRHHSRFRCEGARAKSEERGREDRVKIRPLARSTDASMEVLRAADSSPNVTATKEGSLTDLAGEEDEDIGVYADSYKSSTWIYIGDSEEMHVWQKPETKGEDKVEERSGEYAEEQVKISGNGRRDSAESTSSERDFRRKYQAITHRMVHRKSSVEMYKRLASKSFGDAHLSLHRNLEELLKLMLSVWCKQAMAVRMRSLVPHECDKTVVVHRQSGEFGFRIHGSRPVVVSAIEPDTPAETSGLEVGDIVISVNGVNVLEASHSEVVKLAHAAGSDTLELEVARTCNVLTPVVREPGAGAPLYSGYLWKLGGSSSSGTNNKKWVQRWFCLKRDNCLYYYKTDAESQPLGALMLANYSVARTSDSGRQHSFLLSRLGAIGLHLAADADEMATRWLAVISHSIERNKQVDEWLDISNRNMKLAASAVQQPDCFGYLMKLGHKWKAWKRRYCVLKDACLYFYQDGTSDSALGMACLHGYRVQNSTVGGKRFAFEILPPEPRQRHYFLHTDTEMDKKRWLAALEYSIDRWIKVG